ncbi:MAG: hypothetical protein L6437_02820 [Kiritimatiellae bacterium]|nr:hypothetical protein [Verrucomicrobiota bacterium]MCG2659163.1 hypothetical protein [Kiritimatiellia bacterium]
MKTVKLLAVFIVMGWILSVPCVMANQDAPADVQQAAAQGLQPFLNKIPVISLEEYGFAPGDSLDTASLGDPFLVYTIPPRALDQYQAGSAVTSIVTPTTMWYFPVLIAEQSRAILVVDWLDNQWQAVSLGYAGLAKELGALSRQWKASQGYHPMLIVVFQAKQYLFTVPEKDSQNLTRLVTQKPMATGKPADDYATLGTAASVIEQLKPVVKDALK